MSEQEPGLEEDPRIGRMIGNYRVTRLIGRGGFGSVYLASHPDIDLQVAIKVLDMNRPDIVQRFMAEAHAASKLKHPNIIKIFDLGKTEDGHAYYNMEALEGMELEELMTRWLQARGRMSMAKLAPYLEQICSALELAHDQGIVHRDLKPENIFLEGGAGGTVKVLDFGIAKQRDSAGARTKTGIILGTPQYMSPEQCAGRVNDITARSDIYSLGVIIYRCLGGELPFTEEQTTLLLQHHMTVPPQELSDLSPDLPPAMAKLVMDCLAKDQTLRPASSMGVWQRYEEAMGAAGDTDPHEMEPDLVEPSADSGWDQGWTLGEEEGALFQRGPDRDAATAVTVDPGAPTESGIRKAAGDGRQPTPPSVETIEGESAGRMGLKLPLLVGGTLLALGVLVVLFIRDQGGAGPAHHPGPTPEDQAEVARSPAASPEQPDASTPLADSRLSRRPTPSKINPKLPGKGKAAVKRAGIRRPAPRRRPKPKGPPKEASRPDPAPNPRPEPEPKPEPKPDPELELDLPD